MKSIVAHVYPGVFYYQYWYYSIPGVCISTFPPPVTWVLSQWSNVPARSHSARTRVTVPGYPDSMSCRDSLESVTLPAV
eukprot:1559325-Rhodomonas_salina.1